MKREQIHITMYVKIFGKRKILLNGKFIEQFCVYGRCVYILNCYETVLIIISQRRYGYGFVMSKNKVDILLTYIQYVKFKYTMERR